MLIAGYSEDLAKLVLLGGMMVETTIDFDSLPVHGQTLRALVPMILNERVVESRGGAPALVRHQDH